MHKAAAKQNKNQKNRTLVGQASSKNDHHRHHPHGRFFALLWEISEWMVRLATVCVRQNAAAQE